MKVYELLAEIGVEDKFRQWLETNLVATAEERPEFAKAMANLYREDAAHWRTTDLVDLFEIVAGFRPI